jgi:hypothetical protein
VNVRILGLSVALAFALPASIGAAETPVGGIVVGASLLATVRENGIPTAVETLDSGNRLTFPNAVAYTNDDGVIIVAETATGSAPIEVDGKTRTFAIGSYSSAQADLDLSTVAEFATESTRTYRLSPQRELVLTFDKTTQKLTRISYGQRGQLARMGLISGDDILKAVPYKAPRIHTTALKDGTGTHVTIVKLDIGRDGDVKNVAVVVPSGDATFDASLAATMSTDKYLSAQLGGRAIAATFFRELRH